eukprot:Tbor_TRINITY_DN1862_c0_g1::TRINITY_DN1862_c0_g1_i1::g.23025::m.23025
MSASSLSNLIGQLSDQGVQDYVVFRDSGLPEETRGYFSSSLHRIGGEDSTAVVQNRLNAAYQILRHAQQIMRDGEKLKRVTVKFTGAVYVASSVLISGKIYGVVVRRNGDT